MKRALAAGFAIAGSLVCTAAGAQDLALTGLNGQTATLSEAQIAAMPHTALTVSVEGKTTTFSGVPLSSLLALVGAPSGKALKGPDLADVVVVSAKDGYIVALSLAETDPMVRKEAILLADRADGAALPAGQGPYRLVIEGDLRGARMARMVTGISVKRLAPRPL